MTRDVAEIIQELHQTQSAKKRKDAILQFAYALRRGDNFQPAWDAVGGAPGLASLMAEFSILDLRRMCKSLGCTASAEKARPQRRAALEELVTILYEGREDDRPLTNFYQEIIPACNLELIQKFEKDRKIEWTVSQNKRLFLGHREHAENRFLDKIFSEEKKLTFFQQRRWFHDKPAFCEKILTTLLAKEGKIHVPSDLIEQVAMPLLKRSLKRRRGNDVRMKYLSLTLGCISKHEEEIAGRLKIQEAGSLQYIADQWGKAREGSESKRQYESFLAQIIGLLPREKSPLAIGRVHQTIRVSWELNNKARYEFFRLFLLHHKDYRIDIEDTSEQTLARLKQIPERAWPCHLFVILDYKKSLLLFEKLENVFPKGNFLQASTNYTTILSQSQGHTKHSGFGDIEIVRALLIRKSKTQDQHPGWLERAISHINERRTNAQQSREAVDRAYWARAAINLCVAVGDLQTLNDTVIWSRRFIKDPLTSMNLFTEKVFNTTEFQELLASMPNKSVGSPKEVVSFTSSLVKQDLEFANKILINIVETATLAVGEPGFNAKNWSWVLNIVRDCARQRMDYLDNFFSGLKKCTDADRDKCQRDMMDIVWKPTTDAFIQVGVVIRNPALGTKGGRSLFDSLTTGADYDSANGLHIYNSLARRAPSPPLLAELARFLIDQMRARLGSEAMRAQLPTIVSAIKSLAASDQPSLACPFIRDLVLDGESAKESSSWHRELLNVGFLSVLPSKVAKDVLYNMASAMKEKMREQNQNTDAREEAAQGTDAPAEVSASQGPSIKVTTVKMLAQLLQHNLFMDPSSSCEILIGLLAEARHIDIRIAITTSLFAIIEEPACPSNLRKRILDALEEYIVPAAAQLSERRGMTETDWVAASAQGSPLPDIGGEATLFYLLIDKVCVANLNEEDRTRLASLVMGAVEQSAVNNSRWLKLFLAKNNFSLDEDEEIPQLPVHVLELSAIFRRLMPYTPVSVFNMVRSAALINIDPSPGIERITNAIREDRDLVNSKAGKHWISLFANRGRDSFKFGALHSAGMVQRSPAERESKLDENGISLQMLQSFVIEYVEKLLKVGQAEMVKTILLSLGGNRFGDRENWDNWRKNSVPIIKQIISMTEDLQVRIHSKEAEPRMLPSVFWLSLKTMPVPLLHAKVEEEQTFVEELYKLVGNLAGRQHHPYHMDLEKLKEEFDYQPLNQSCSRFALMLEETQEYDLSSTEQPTLRDYLCWELLGHMLTKAKDPKDEEVVKKVRQLMRKWESCEDETMRTMGMKYKQILKDHADKIWYN
ncbi:hypothetical protein F53441_7204 [Fusarium austroafricanum]|uniref:Uncharacterized protein n=1 Tax=Fusarium austroafricanum TaxID=2364996 RepID=A0A8H4KE06_9HYPO|nr:hypothetical protein F53441_7204 [Fusarium austroafricanum]